ncbi:hypothetical protein [Dyella sp.]|uniref:hypothetical protein n=1 Tax=Dyella sp. TaxID=1869338 RepID=UPI002FDAE6BC
MNWLRRMRGRTGLVVGWIGAVLLGYWAGWATFRLPVYACGPFNSDRFALWAAAIAGSAAAGATYYAARIALSGGKEAIENERSLRDQEAQQVEEERKRKAANVAHLIVPSLYELAFGVVFWHRLAGDSRFTTSLVSKYMLSFNLDTLNAAAEKVDLLDAVAARNFSIILGLARNLHDQMAALQPEIVLPDNAHMTIVREGIARATAEMRDNAVNVYLFFKQLAGDMSPMEYPRERAEREYERLAAQFET